MKFSLFAFVFVLSFFFSNFSFARPSTEPFFKHFEVTYNSNGEADAVYIKGNLETLPIEQIFWQILRDLADYKRSGLSAEQFLEQNIDQNDFSEWPLEQRTQAVVALKQLENIDVRELAENTKIRKVLVKFKERFAKHLRGYKTLARPSDSVFFYSRDVMAQAVAWAVSFAERQITDNVPLLNIAKYVAQRMGKMIEYRRTFYQNMLFYYLEQFEPADLKLSEKDVAQIRSSIYESRLTWYSWFEAKKLRKEWSRYGNWKFDRLVNAGTLLVYNTRDRYKSVEDRLNFAFQTVTTDQYGKVVLNLLDAKHRFSKEISIAYYYKDPKKVAKHRRMVQLTQLGMHVIVAPALVKSIYDDFVESMYIPQSLNEGALAGYFESTGEAQILGDIISQTQNPLLAPDFK